MADRWSWSDLTHAYPFYVEAEEPNPESENDETWLEQAEVEAEIEADWEQEGASDA